MKEKREWVSLSCFLTTAAFLLLPTPADTPSLLAQKGIRPASSIAHSSAIGEAARARLVSSYGKLPLSFEPNQGQTDEEVKFTARGPGYSLFLTGNEAVLSLRSVPEGWAGKDGMPRAKHQPARADVLRMKLAGASSNARVTGLDELPGKSNYFIGNDPKAWHTNVPNYTKVRYKNVYPGIDLVYYGNQRQLEYDFVVAPGADPKAIALEITGLQGSPQTSLAENGDLVIKADSGEVRLVKPVVYQAENSGSATSTRKPIKGRFVLLAKNRIGFEVSSYDATKPLIIDPVLAYSTFMGGSGSDTVWDIAVDASGNVYATGETQSTDFPVANSLQTNLAGGTCAIGSYTFPCPDVFVSKLNAAGDTLVYSTFLGGGDSDIGYGIAVDSADNAYITGETSSSDFPIVNPISGTYGGGGDIFVAKLSSTGAPLMYSTYYYLTHYGEGLRESGADIAVDANGTAFVVGTIETDTRGLNLLLLEAAPPGALSVDFGGSDDDWAQGIALGADDEKYMVGTTRSADFYTTSDAYQPTFGGGTCATEPAAACPDAFILRLVPNMFGSYTRDYSSFLGGGNSDSGNSIAVDSMGRVYVAGQTWSADFPTTPNAYQTVLNGDTDAFVTRLTIGASNLDYSTYLGGEFAEEALAIAVDGSGNAVVTGNTSSHTFPTVKPIQATLGGELATNAFVTKVNSAGSALAFSTYLGATGSESDYVSDSGNAVGLDASGNIYVAGRTSSASFPTVNALQSTYKGSGDGFIAKISPVGLGISPTNLDFGTIGIGATSSAKVVTLNNGGTGPVSIINIATTGDFQQSNTCGSILAGGSSCTISATFTPTAKDTRTGELTVTTSVAGIPPPVSLTGIGSESTLTVSPDSLTFGDQLSGSTSDPQTVTLTNTGSVAVTFRGIDPAADFTHTNNCGTSLAAGDSCTIDVSFTPQSAGPMSEQITVNHNAAGGKNIITVGGRGTDFALQPGSGGKPSATVTAGETATYDLSVMTTGFSGSVTMGCTWKTSQPQGTSCSVSPATITLNGGGAAEATVSITTTARSMAPVGWNPTSPAPNGYPVSHLAIWLLVLAALASLALRRRRATVVLASAIFVTVLWTACGGGTTPSSTPTASASGTPAGTYSLTVTGTTGSVSHTTDLTLTVE